MKKAAFLLIIPILLLLFSASGQKPCSAESVYARVVSENAAFYSDAGATMVKFVLPVGYFVKIKEIGNDYTRVIYMDGASGTPTSEGYVSNADLKFGEENVETPYPSLIITAKCDEVLFSDSQLTHPRSVISEGSTAIFYGTLTYGGEKYLYVYSSGVIGYVRQNAFSDFTVPPHPTFNVEEPPLSATQSNETSEKSKTDPSLPASNSQIIVIGIIILAALALFYLIMRPEKRRAQEHSFYGDKDDV